MQPFEGGFPRGYQVIKILSLHKIVYIVSLKCAPLAYSFTLRKKVNDCCLEFPVNWGVFFDEPRDIPSY